MLKLPGEPSSSPILLLPNIVVISPCTQRERRFPMLPSNPAWKIVWDWWQDHRVPCQLFANQDSDREPPQLINTPRVWSVSTFPMCCQVENVLPSKYFAAHPCLSLSFPHSPYLLRWELIPYSSSVILDRRLFWESPLVGLLVHFQEVRPQAWAQQPFASIHLAWPPPYLLTLRSLFSNLNRFHLQNGS